MWPTLISLGALRLSTVTVVLLLGFLVSGFTFWRRGKEEHYSELQLFDGFLLSFIVGAIGARLVFVLLHFGQFGWSIFEWLSVVNKPGTHELAFLVISTLFLYRFAVRKKWDAYEVLDFWSLSLAVWLLFSSLADFTSGAGRGKFTQLPIGVTFPGSIEKTHPVQLYFAIFYLLLYVYLHWAESRYRIFEWYRLGRKSAHTGFLISTFTFFFAVFSALMLLFRLPEFPVFGFNLDIWLYLLGAILGVQVLLRRSDKPLLPESFKERFAKSGKSEEVTPPLQS
ncbi:MAG: Prolipoprotein diacylglyceryl transferase [Candidatus Pacebacteria bacterium GW2011_GWB1_47_8]|nr:MAG: Prolipoprotein diacylglyceryl transferase [Candidatus Pacebacteria bacterium GW2011_GWA1_46_10]KKU84711.1 MAG: Prolipoprotein diacylglyceryl transferase [Candidatus Pacebacteria bacterium GW2011_GWB1_47_8]